MRFGISPEDDPGFVRVGGAILDAVVADSPPEVVAVIQIDRWFDFKWLHFSGKAVGEVGRWKKELTLPPFHPRRVKMQTVLRRAEGGDYREIDAPPVHVEQSSATNLFRKLDHLTDRSHSSAPLRGDAVFAWWTGDTVATGRGSLMVYSRIDGQTTAWFAGFKRYQEWRVHRTREIPVEAVQELIDGVETDYHVISREQFLAKN